MPDADWPGGHHFGPWKIANGPARTCSRCDYRQQIDHEDEEVPSCEGQSAKQPKRREIEGDERV